MVWGKIFLILLGIILIIIGLNEPMILIFPMWILIYLLKDKLRDLLKKIPLMVSFVGAGIFFGIITEIFAIIENISKPAEQRILLSPDPLTDIIFGLFYYLSVILAWYFLLKKINYSQKDVFLITGIYGIFTEEVGQVFLRIFSVPILGLLYAFMIMFVYGIFPMLTYLINEKRFIGNQTKTNLSKRYIFALVALFIQYAIYGLVILPLLISLVGQ